MFCRVFSTPAVVIFATMRLCGQDGGKEPVPGSGAPPVKVAAPLKLPASLDEMLAIALRSNPEILQAEAKLRMAQANLNQCRLKVTQEVLATHEEKKKHEAALEVYKHTFDSLSAKVKVGVADADSVLAPRRAMVETVAQVAQVEAQLRYTLGLGGGMALEDGPEGSGSLESSQRKREALSAELLEALGKEVSMDSFQLEDVLHTALARNGKRTAVVFDVAAHQSITKHDPLDELKLQKPSLRAVLSAIADAANVCFVFRDYGILVTTPERAATMLSPVIPEDTPLRVR